MYSHKYTYIAYYELQGTCVLTIYVCIIEKNAVIFTFIISIRYFCPTRLSFVHFVKKVTGEKKNKNIQFIIIKEIKEEIKLTNLTLNIL